LAAVNHLDSKRIRVGIAHEMRVLREGLAALLQQRPEMAVVDITPVAEAQKHQKNRDLVDLVLLDVAGEDTAVADKIQEVKSRFGGAKVIVMGVSDSPSEILACIEAGALAYTSQDSSLQQLVETIQMVYSGQATCPPDISALLFERIASLKGQLGPVEDNRLSKLTRRELETLQLVSDGMSNREIAAHLTLELQTIKNYVHSILEKLRVNNRREAAIYTQYIA